MSWNKKPSGIVWTVPLSWVPWCLSGLESKADDCQGRNSWIAATGRCMTCHWTSWHSRQSRHGTCIHMTKLNLGFCGDVKWKVSGSLSSLHSYTAVAQVELWWNYQIDLFTPLRYCVNCFQTTKSHHWAALRWLISEAPSRVSEILC